MIAWGGWSTLGGAGLNLKQWVITNRVQIELHTAARGDVDHNNTWYALWMQPDSTYHNQLFTTHMGTMRVSKTKHTMQLALNTFLGVWLLRAWIVFVWNRPGYRRGLHIYSLPAEASFSWPQDHCVTQRHSCSAQPSKHNHTALIRACWMRMTSLWCCALYWDL